MLQEPRVCPRCHALSSAGQSFCANCGASLVDTGAPNMPTSAASNPSYSSDNQSTYESTMAAPISSTPPSSSNFLTPPPPPTNSSYGSGANYNSSFSAYPPNPVTPQDPYASAQTPNSAPYPNQYGTYAPPAKAPKKRNVWVYLGVGLAILLVLCVGAGIYGLVKAGQQLGKTSESTSESSTITTNGGSNTGNTGNTSATSTTISNLSFVYASDQITITSVQQASSFKDDDETTFGQSPNYVRVNFKEQQIARGDYANSTFIYTEAFHMLFPDGSDIAAQNSQADLGPDQGVVRTNWADFPASGKVDLSKLTMRVGSSDEQQMDIPLQSNANLSKYQPKTVTLNKTFTYASMNWTLVSATQSLSLGGSQAKSGKVYISVSLKVTNNSQEEFFGADFTRLKADGNVTSSDDTNSSMNAFDDVQPGTSNAQGTDVFLTPASSSGSYTLNFLASTDSSSNITRQSVTFQIQ